MYILIYCYEREINLWGTFETENQAYDAMEKDLAKILEVEIPKSWDDIEERYNHFDIQPNSAWVNNRDKHDWKIIKL